MRLIGLADANGLGEGVVDLEDDALGAVFAVELLFVLAADDGEGVHDVGHGIVRGREAGLEAIQIFLRLSLSWAPVPVCLGRQVKVEEGGIQLAA